MNIYKYLSYKDYLKHVLSSHDKTRGYQSRLAEISGCQRSYFSQVLNANAQLSIEQAWRLCEYWGFTDSESDYFFALIEYEKVSLPTLKTKLKMKLDKMAEDQQDLIKRYQSPKIQQLEFEKKYYANWQWAAIHVLVSIAEYQTIDKITKYLNLPETMVRKCLLQLQEMGLVDFKQGRWSTQKSIHLSKDSSMNATNHFNWRQKAISDSLMEGNQSLHCTMVQSHAESDYIIIKDMLLNCIDEIRKVIKPSKEEKLTSLCLDFFVV